MDSQLDFGLLDDVLPVASASAAASAEIIAATHAGLGPLVEYAFLSRQKAAYLPPVSRLSDCQPVLELRRVLRLGGFGRMGLSTSRQGREVEFHWCPLDAEGFLSPGWVTFRLRLQNAAERAGFSHRIAAGLTGAFGEMADNAFRHCLRVQTALAGYAWSDGRFEYVVADAGRGVLASLRSCPDYADLQDVGAALQVALTDGESRFGRGSGHGCGFSEVFLSLAELNGCLRFRSDDHALSINGRSPHLSIARLAQLGMKFDGFLVSVVCRLS